MTAGFEAAGRPSSERGFTLVELIFVMAIAGILAAVAMPRLVGTNSFDTRGFSDQLAATVRFAQKLAIAQRREAFVQLSASTATLCYSAGVPCSAQAPGPGGEKPYTISAPGDVAIASPVAVLRFDAGGRPDIAAALDIQVTGAATHHVRVEQETGYVHD
jgi:MSHA pilin protein MshC